MCWILCNLTSVLSVNKSTWINGHQCIHRKKDPIFAIPSWQTVMSECSGNMKLSLSAETKKRDCKLSHLLVLNYNASDPWELDMVHSTEENGNVDRGWTKHEQVSLSVIINSVSNSEVRPWICTVHGLVFISFKGFRWYRCRREPNRGTNEINDSDIGFDRSSRRRRSSGIRKGKRKERTKKSIVITWMNRFRWNSSRKMRQSPQRRAKLRRQTAVRIKNIVVIFDSKRRMNRFIRYCWDRSERRRAT